MMSSFRDKLVPLKESMVLDAAIAAETLIEEPLHEVIKRAEILGTMPSCLINYRDPLQVLLDRESRGEFHWHDSITGITA
jgi:hypothetical protein